MDDIEFFSIKIKRQDYLLMNDAQDSLRGKHLAFDKLAVGYLPEEIMIVLVSEKDKKMASVCFNEMIDQIVSIDGGANAKVFSRNKTIEVDADSHIRCERIK